MFVDPGAAPAIGATVDTTMHKVHTAASLTEEVPIALEDVVEQLHVIPLPSISECRHIMRYCLTSQHDDHSAPASLLKPVHVGRGCSAFWLGGSPTSTTMAMVNIERPA